MNNYMSPELIKIIENQNDVNIILLEKVNVFSIGIILI